MNVIAMLQQSQSRLGAHCSARSAADLRETLPRSRRVNWSRFSFCWGMHPSKKGGTRSRLQTESWPSCERLFDLGTGGRRSQENDDESATVKAPDPVERATGQAIECSHGGAEHDQPVCYSTHLSLPVGTDLVEIRKAHRPHSLRRCSGPGTAR